MKYVQTRELIGLLLVLSVLIAGCASFDRTQPNISIFSAGGSPLDDNAASIARLLTAIAERNALLFEELGKLPELQDGINDRDLTALKHLSMLYGENTARFDLVFSQMYHVGQPEVRKYCTPLQALFWLLEDGQLQPARRIVAHYSLEQLLCVSWPTPNLYDISWPSGKIKKAAKGCKSTGSKINPYTLALSLDLAGYYLLKETDDPEAFEYKGDNNDSNFMHIKTRRWGNFKAVVDRLNAPALIDFYERHNLRYDYYLGARRSNRTVFKSKRANCVDTTQFAVQCLQRAGYKAEGISVPPEGRTPADAHLVTKFYVRGRIFIMDNGRSDPQGIAGPLNSIEGIPYWLNY